MAERLNEAQERGLWRPRSNSAAAELSALRRLPLDTVEVAE
jgi:cobalamin biosynthesis Mg chelatase CobN